MTEQFSQEYIAFIRKAKVLQTLWVPAAGDWVLLTHRGKQEVNCLGTMDDSRDWVEWAKEALEYRHIVWLPTLFQLTRVIEGAGWEWQRTIDGRWLIKTCSDYYTVSAKGDDLLAAAQLAVRAVEEA